VLVTKDARDILGVDVKDNKLILKQPEDEALYHLAVLVTDIVTKTKKVTQLDSKEQRIEYAKSIAAKPLPIVEMESGSSGKAGLKKGKSSKQVIISRNTLVPNGLNYNVGHPRLAKIFWELQHMNLETYINACAVMFRVFIEMSVDDYAQRHNINLTVPIKNPKPGMKQQAGEMNLRNKLDTLVKYFETQNLCTKDELFGVKTIINNKEHVLSIYGLHAYVHNKDYSPSPSDLKSSWDNIQIFVHRLWGLI
jgi:hypothetical protein